MNVLIVGIGWLWFGLVIICFIAGLYGAIISDLEKNKKVYNWFVKNAATNGKTEQQIQKSVHVAKADLTLTIKSKTKVEKMTKYKVTGFMNGIKVQRTTNDYELALDYAKQFKKSKITTILKSGFKF